MELHIKNFSYQNVQKHQGKIDVFYLLTIIISLGASSSLIIYDFYQVFIATFIISLIVAVIFIKKSIKEKKLQKSITYDLVIVDQENRFFYNNIFIEMNDLERFLIVDTGIHLYFKDYYLFIENSEGIVEYLKKFTDNIASMKMNMKNYFVSIMLFTGGFLVVKNISDILLGLIYCQLTQSVLFDVEGLLINLAQIAILLIAVLLAVILAKKYKKSIHLPAYFTALILYLVLPYILNTNALALSDDIVYLNQNNQSIEVYTDVKNYFGKSAFSLEGIDQSARIDIYEDIIYVINHNELYTYNLKDEKYYIDDIINQYNNYYFTVTIKDNKNILEIKDNEFYFTNDDSKELNKIDVNVIGKNIISFQYDGKYYFVNFSKTNRNFGYGYIFLEICLVDTGDTYSLDRYEGEYVKKVEQEQTYEEVIEYEEKKDVELYQQRYNEYQEVIQQNDVTNFQSTQNVVKVNCTETDIYRVIKAVDTEITRLNNEEGVVLDVQITNMQVYSQNNDEYGIYINTAVDRNGERGYGYSEVILMKKYGNDYIATRLSNDYMPNTGATNNGIYYTNTTTEFLYRVEGNKVVPNAW